MERDLAQAHGTAAFALGVLSAISLFEPGSRGPISRDEIRAFLGRAQSHAVAEHPEMRGAIDGDLTVLDV